MSIIDLHCDTISSIFRLGEHLQINSCHFDFARARQAGVSLQVFAMFASPSEGSNSLRQILKQVDYFYQQIESSPELVYLVTGCSDLKKPENAGKIGCLLHLEGADALGNDPELLRLFYRLGLRSMGLTWNHRNLLADGVGEGKNGGGLSNLGRKTIMEMNRLHMILDLAHAAPRSFYEALEVSTDPVMVSHANAQKVCSHPRNLDDDQLRALAGKNGIIGVTMVNEFVGQDSPGIDNLLDHIVYISELIGVSKVALGSDFDGADDLVMAGIESYAEWESLLTGRGFSGSEQEMILKGNACRLFESILR